MNVLCLFNSIIFHCKCLLGIILRRVVEIAVESGWDNFDLSKIGDDFAMLTNISDGSRFLRWFLAFHWHFWCGNVETLIFYAVFSNNCLQDNSCYFLHETKIPKMTFQVWRVSVMWKWDGLNGSSLWRLFFF